MRKGHGYRVPRPRKKVSKDSCVLKYNRIVIRRQKRCEMKPHAGERGEDLVV